MDKALNVAVIGAGSTYTPELVDGFLSREDRLPVAEFRFFDIDAPKQATVGGLCQRMIERSGSKARLSFAADIDEAVRGADFVVCQIRVGGLAARALDERIPVRHGLIGQETTGLGGFMQAMRTLPALTRIAGRVAALAPDAWLVNFANPSGLMAEALINGLGFTRVIGLCNVPINMKADIAAFAPPGSSVEMEYVGLNHFSWVTKVLIDGEESLARALGSGLKAGAMKNIPDSEFGADLLAAIGALPNSYLQYYYYRDRQLAHLSDGSPCRAEECMLIEKELLAAYGDESLSEKPAALEKRGGHLYSEAAVSLIEAIANDTGAVHVVNVRNRGALEFLDADDVAEVACRVGRDGPEPIPVRGFDNRHVIGMVRMMKAYERQATIAAMAEGREAAMRASMRALLMHPLCGDYDRTLAALDEILAADIEHLPQFKARP